MSVKRNEFINRATVNDYASGSAIDICPTTHTNKCTVTWQIDIDRYIERNAWYGIIRILFAAKNSKK
jgi:hypothetical protein